MMEYNFQLVIVPEDYDYGEEEIAYRIYFNDQLISERSLPILEPNQGIVDTFNLNIPDKFKTLNLSLKNLKNKKCLYEKIKMNDFYFSKNTHNIKIKGLNLKLFWL